MEPDGQDSTKKLLEERQAMYGDAWRTTSHVARELRAGESPLGQSTLYMYAWMTILSKLIRALASPENVDHWDDIQGYARLVSDDIRSRT